MVRDKKKVSRKIKKVKKEVKEQVSLTYPLFILIILVLINIGLMYLHQFSIQDIQNFVSNIEIEGVRDYISSFGMWAPVVFVLFAIFQALAVPLPAAGAAVTVAGGILFGLWGLPLSLTGVFIGSVLCFLVSQKIGRPIIEWINPGGFGKFDKFMEKRGMYAVFVLRLIPLTPYDTVSYIAGLTKLKLKDFAMASFFGSITTVTFYTLMGTNLAKGNWWTLGVILLASLLIFLAIPWIQKRFLDD